MLADGRSRYAIGVTVWEALPKGWAWETPNGEPADQFDWPTLGSARLPAKRTAHGGSRSIDLGPFAVRPRPP